MRVTKRDWGSLYETDVLILGTGASGMGAALKAAEKHADVLMLGKGTLESSGSLGGGNDHFMAVLDTDEAYDNVESFVDFYMKSAYGYRREQLVQWHDAFAPCLAVLDEVGTEFKPREGGGRYRSIGFGQPGAWGLHIFNGRTIKRNLAKKIRRLDGVSVLDDIQITRMFARDGKVTGCMGFNVLSGETVAVACKTAVSCLGWHAQRAANNSTNNPFNCWFTPFTTGSYFTQAYHIGAAVINADISGRTTMLPKGWGAPGMNGINNMGGKELNARGERFMGKYDPMLENGLRRNQVMGTYQEGLEGNGPPFFMDMTHFDPEEARHLRYDLMPGDKETYLEYCEARNIDFTKTPLEVEISERMIGGVVKCTDEQETEVRNLYTASLCNNFSAAMCLGWAAGEFAAARAVEVAMPSLPEAEIGALAKTVFAPLAEKPAKSIGYTEFEDGIRQVMDYYVGYQRTEGSMKQALKSFAVLEEYLPRLGASTLRELMRVRESIELFKLCRIYIQACMQRRESGRAMYRRADYPDLDPALEKCLVTRLDESGNPVFQWNS